MKVQLNINTRQLDVRRERDRERKRERKNERERDERKLFHQTQGMSLYFFCLSSFF